MYITVLLRIIRIGVVIFSLSFKFAHIKSGDMRTVLNLHTILITLLA